MPIPDTISADNPEAYALTFTAQFTSDSTSGIYGTFKWKVTGGSGFTISPDVTYNDGKSVAIGLVTSDVQTNTPYTVSVHIDSEVFGRSYDFSQEFIFHKPSLTASSYRCSAGGLNDDKHSAKLAYVNDSDALPLLVLKIEAFDGTDENYYEKVAPRVFITTANGGKFISGDLVRASSIETGFLIGAYVKIPLKGGHCSNCARIRYPRSI